MILRFIKKCFLWTYARNTWQWDVLCVLILAFIFLSPKTWFVNAAKPGSSGQPSQAVVTVILGPETLSKGKDKDQLEQQVRALTGRPNAQVIEVRQKQDGAGKTLSYEVDIR